MKKRRVILLGLAIGICLLFGGCRWESTATVTENEKIFDMQLLEEDDGVMELYRDRNTDVLYIYRDPRAGLIEMHDPKTGLPLTYERYKEMYHARVGETEN